MLILLLKKLLLLMAFQHHFLYNTLFSHLPVANPPYLHLKGILKLLYFAHLILAMAYLNPISNQKILHTFQNEKEVFLLIPSMHLLRGASNNNASRSDDFPILYLIRQPLLRPQMALDLPEKNETRLYK